MNEILQGIKSAAGGQQFGVKLPKTGLGCIRGPGPGEFRLLECRFIEGIERFVLPMRVGELKFASVPDSGLKFRITKVTEEGKRTGLSIFFTHEKLRDIGRKKQETGGEPLFFRGNQSVEAIAAGTVADLVVSLNADDEAIA